MDRANSYVAGYRHKDNSHFFIKKNKIRQLDINSNVSTSAIERLGQLMLDRIKVALLLIN